jgi:hypothetical protein
MSKMPVRIYVDRNKRNQMVYSEDGSRRFEYVRADLNCGTCNESDGYESDPELIYCSMLNVNKPKHVFCAYHTDLESE